MGGIHEGHSMTPSNKSRPTVDQMRQALMQKANMPHMAGGGILQDVIKKPNQLSGVVLSGASWLAGDEKTKLANKAFGQDVTNTAVGGQKTADVLNQLNVFERDGGTFAPGTTVVLDIGANDIATGVDPSITRANLDEIVSRLGESGVSIILSAQPFANSFQEAIDNPNLVMNEMYSDIANNNPNVTLVDAMSGFLNQKNLMDESGFHLNNDQSKADYIGKFADAYKATHPTQNTVDTTDINTNPIGALPTNNVQDTTTQLTGTNQQSSPLQQAAVVDQTPPTPQEPIQQMSYKMPEYQMESTPSFKDFGNYGDVMERAEGGEVRTQQPFDYDNPSHVRNVANIAAKHRDFNQIPDAAKHLAGVLSQGSYKFVEDPRIQSAIKQAGHNGYYISGKDGKQQIIRKAEGGAVLPIEQIKAQMMNRFKGLGQLQSIGAEEAPSMGVKAYVPTSGSPDADHMPVGGIDTAQGDLPVGGIDMSKMQPGQQLMPNAPPAPAGAQAGMNQVPRGDKIATKDGTGMPPNPNANPNQMGSNILSMTPQGQAMAALKPQGLASGGQVSIDQMRNELLNRQRPLAMTDDHGYADGGQVSEETEAPKKTVKAYKLFRTDKKKPGKLFPLFVNANKPVEMNKWVAAQEGEMKGKKVKSKIGPLAYRPGWHAGDLPVATHIGEKSDPKLNAPDTRPDNHVWAEVELPHDKDWQTEADKRGMNAKGKLIAKNAHITDQIPHGGHYRYKTNSNMTGNWLIGGAMKVNRVLPDAEVKKINKAAGVADLPRRKTPKMPELASGGSTKGYVKSTPKKPHPEVGQRFTATPQGNLVAPQQFDIMKQEGKGSIVPVPYDATTRDNRVTEVSGHQLTEPLVTEAGFDYAMDPKHVAQAIGGASNLGIAGRVQDRINQAAREHEGDVYLAPNTMSEKAENFSHHPAHIVLDLMKQRQLNKKTLKALSDDLRSQPETHPTTKQKIYPYKNFVGFDHPNLGEQVMKGGHGLETTAGNLRKKMMDRLSLVNIQELLDYNLGDLKASILHPDIASDPKGYMGRTLVKAQAGAPLRLSRHKSYDTDYTGTYAGGFGNRPIETVMPDLYQEVETELKQRPVKKAKTETEYRNQVIGALEKRKEKVAQPINARVINNAGLYEEGLKNGEFDPKNLDSVLAYYKRKGGYKAGGKVKLHTDQDTMRLALTRTKKAK